VRKDEVQTASVDLDTHRASMFAHIFHNMCQTQHTNRASAALGEGGITENAKFSNQLMVFPVITMMHAS
jgi:hypothetical protein